MNRREKYERILIELPLLIGTGGKYVTDRIGRMAIFCAVLKREFPELVFVGFYLSRDGQLHIGPYQGGIIACTPIPFGKGVCGTAATKSETLIVQDVCDFPGYIACDSETRSEIVLPVFENEQFIGVLDIDSADPATFDERDQHYLELLLKIIFSAPAS